MESVHLNYSEVLSDLQNSWPCTGHKELTWLFPRICVCMCACVCMHILNVFLLPVSASILRGVWGWTHAAGRDSTSPFPRLCLISFMEILLLLHQAGASEESRAAVSQGAHFLSPFPGGCFTLGFSVGERVIFIFTAAGCDASRGRGCQPLQRGGPRLSSAVSLPLLHTQAPRSFMHRTLGS